MSRRSLAGFLLLAVAVAACPGENPAFVARAFVKAAFVARDRAAGLALSTGTARSKLEGEKIMATEERGEIEYKEIARRIDPEGVRVDFVLTPRGEEQPRHWIAVFLHRIDSNWRVIDYDVSEQPIPASAG